MMAEGRLLQKRVERTTRKPSWTQHYTNYDELAYVEGKLNLREALGVMTNAAQQVASGGDLQTF